MEVPEELTALYAVAEPSPVWLDAYLQNGVDVVEDRTAEVQRVQDLGGLDREPNTVAATITRPTIIHKSGAAYSRRGSTASD